MPSEFVPPGSLSGINVVDISGSTFADPSVMNPFLAGLIANGVNGGTLTLGANIPDVLGMALCTQLLSSDRGPWTINCDGAIIKKDTTFTVNEDGTYFIDVLAAGTVTYQWQYQNPDLTWSNDAGKTSAVYDNPSLAILDYTDVGGRLQYRCAITKGAVTDYSTPIQVDVPQFVSGPDTFSLTDPVDYENLIFSNDTHGLGLPSYGYIPDHGAGKRVDWTWTKDGVDQGNDVGRPKMQGEFVADTDNVIPLLMDGTSPDDQGVWKLKLLRWDGLIVLGPDITITP